MWQQRLNPDLSEEDRITIQKLLNGTPEEREAAFNHPQFSIIDWTQTNNKWRQIPRWVDTTSPVNKSISNILKKLNKEQ